MRLPLIRAGLGVAVCALVATIGAGSLASAQTYGTQPSTGQEKKDKPPVASEGERQAAMKIASAADYSAALQQAGEFVKKYPKSSLRPEITRGLVAKAAGTQDTAQQITMLENALGVLKELPDVEIITPVLVDAYLKAEKLDDAFRVAGSVLEKKPDDLITLTQMAIIGFDQAKRNNTKFVQQSMQYAPKAIALIEADKRPAGLADAQWTEYKTLWLPRLYQNLGLVALMTKNTAEAKAKLDKSAALNPSDPFTYVLLGSLVQDEYAALAQQVKGMLPGKAQDDVLKKALEKLDQLIEIYAHAVGLSENDAQYKQLHDELMVDLKSYYSYRHNNSADGLQQLIDKYKKPL